MGLVFTVGRPASVFDDPVAELMDHVLGAECEGHLAPGGGEVEAFQSSELGWSGWSLLQERARVAVEPEELPNFLSMEAWHGAFLPGWTEAGSIVFDDYPIPLDVASLDGLIVELERVGPALGLPIDEEGLSQLIARYANDEAADDDMEVQTFAQLLRAARQAQQRRQALWVVK